jgi:hypothetical protein
MGATVVSSVDAPPVLEAPEHVFDLMALFVEDGVMRDRDFPVGFRRKSRGASRQRSPFLITNTIALTIRRSSTRATPCDSGKYRSIRRI